MPIKIKREWELPESAATPESVYWNRRHFLRGLAAGPALLGGAALAAGRTFAADEVDPSAALYPCAATPPMKAAGR